MFGFFPWANWISGGHEAEWYSLVAADWLNGSAIVVGGAVVLTILARRLPLWREGAVRPMLDRYELHPGRWILGIALVSGLLYAIVAQIVLGGRPLLIDEIVQTFQAHIFAQGRLWMPAGAHPEFFSSMHIIDTGGRVYGQFPAGGPAMMLLGTLLGAEWVVGPISGSVAVVAFGYLARRLDTRPGVRLGATLLFAFAPFTVFMSGSHMNHVTTLMWLVIGVAALASVVAAPTPRPLLAFVSGLAFGAAATIRPVDALAFAAPAGVWYLWRSATRPGRWRDMLAAGIGVLLPVGALLWVNAHTTGHPLLFGYSVLWGASHNLGFHETPWGIPHSPARGVELLNLYVLRLQTYLFETPVPSLVPAAVALAFCRRLNPLDRYLLASTAAVLGLYFAYWHDGFYLGPRFMYPLIPILVLWTARLPAILKERFGAGAVYRATVYSYGIAALIAIFVSAPLRGRTYAGGMISPRWNATAAEQEAGIENALVLVRESWGAQLMVRLWALGIERPDGEMLYRSVDRCRLENGIAVLEASDQRGSEALRLLRPLTKDADRVVKVEFSTDPTARILPGEPYSMLCRQRIIEEAAGFTVLPPLLLANRHGNIFARDLHARDTLLLEAYPDRPIYLLKPPSTRVGDDPRFYHVSRDSLRLAWGVDALP